MADDRDELSPKNVSRSPSPSLKTPASVSPSLKTPQSVSTSPSLTTARAESPNPNVAPEVSPRPACIPDNMEELRITINKKEGEMLGVMIDEDLIIAGVKPDTPAAGRLIVGDRIFKVNGIEVKTADHFSELIVNAHPRAVVKLFRESKPLHSVIVNMPRHRAKFCPFRSGFSYQVVRIEVAPERKLGLTIKDCPNGVFVSRVEPNSLACGLLQVGDRLIDVDGKKVTSRDDCKQMMIRNMQAQRFFTSVVERPETPDTKQEVKAALVGIFDSNYAPSVKLNTDVREIAARQRRNIGKNIQPRKAMVKRTDESPDKRARIADEHPAVFVIGSDTEGKQLRHVRKASK